MWISPAITPALLRLHDQFRVLWEQHGVWTRATIESIVRGLPDVQVVTNRLLRNPADFQLVLQAFYGPAIASRFAALLTDHLVIAAELVRAAAAGDDAAAAGAEMRWYANADEIAGFLGSINPWWSAAEWRAMLHHHLALVKAEAVNLIGEDYAAWVAVYDEIERQALGMADTMSGGIACQFPGCFCGQ